MTNGSDKHHDHAGKKKATGEKPKPKETSATLKRKAIVPKRLPAKPE